MGIINISGVVGLLPPHWGTVEIDEWLGAPNPLLEGLSPTKAAEVGRLDDVRSAASKAS